MRWLAGISIRATRLIWHGRAAEDGACDFYPRRVRPARHGSDSRAEALVGTSGENSDHRHHASDQQTGQHHEGGMLCSPSAFAGPSVIRTGHDWRCGCGRHGRKDGEAGANFCWRQLSVPFSPVLQTEDTRTIAKQMIHREKIAVLFLVFLCEASKGANLPTTCNPQTLGQPSFSGSLVCPPQARRCLPPPSVTTTGSLAAIPSCWNAMNCAPVFARISASAMLAVRKTCVAPRIWRAPMPMQAYRHLRLHHPQGAAPCGLASDSGHQLALDLYRLPAGSLHRAGYKGTLRPGRRRPDAGNDRHSGCL